MAATADAAGSSPQNAADEAVQELQVASAESAASEREGGESTAREEMQSVSNEAQNEQVAVARDASEMNGEGEGNKENDDEGQENELEGGEEGDEVRSKERDRGMKEELQCTLCHDTLFKPITTLCGHSFCRVCLVESLLSKDLSEAQCPICRGLVLYKSLGGSNEREPTPAFSINVTLWNVIQVLLPTVCDRDSKEEEEDFCLKYDQFDAKWRIDSLRRSSSQLRPQRRRRPRVDDDGDSDTDGDENENEGVMDDGANSDDEENEDGEAQVRMIRARYPQIRVENTVDGHLEVTRNIVHDRDDANEDGYHSMRLGLAIMEFPSLFQLYNEHQECSIAVLKLEEDEELDGGAPFFMSDDGDDDNFVVSDYYNEIKLSVVDDAGNIVMDRTRGASQGIVTFPQMRLDVPGGMYTFRFTDDLYGLFLKIRVELRESYGEDDVSLAELAAEEQDRRRGRIIMGEAGERGRSRRGRVPSEDEDEEDGDDSDSNDSFIVNDEEDEGRFSGSESGGDEAEHEEDEEDAMERIVRRRMRPERESSRSDGDDSHGEDIDLGDRTVWQPSQSDHDDEEYIVPRRVSSRMRVVDDDEDSDHSVPNEVIPDTSEGERDARSSLVEATAQTHGGMKRIRTVMEADSDDIGPRAGVDEASGSDRTLLPSKRLRQVTSNLFHNSDDEEDDRNVSYYGELEAEGSDDDNADGFQSRRGRWIGSNPYWSRRSRTIDEEDESDEALGDDVPVERIEDEVPLEDEEEEWGYQDDDNDDGDFSDA